MADLSNAVGAWHRCPRAACRRGGSCKGADEVLARCMPVVAARVADSLAECIAAIPGAAPRRPSRAQEVADQLLDIQLRTGALISHKLAEMERQPARPAETELSTEPRL
jgi:hypothetical protein